MKQLKRIKLATVIGCAALAAALCAPANAAVVIGGENGWQVSVGGFINLFYTQTNYDYPGGTPSVDNSHLQEGLLPNFDTLTVKTPEFNGLQGTGQITFALDSNSNQGGRLNKNNTFGTGSLIDLREVFFNVKGDFGTISAGRTLSLFQRQAILKDMTLFGMGAQAGPGGGGTGLGRIGFGYVYPDFRTRFSYKTPDINGFNMEVGIFDPQVPIGFSSTQSIVDTPQFQGEATYTHPFSNGKFEAWFSGLWQTQKIKASAGLGGTGTVESAGYNIGLDVSMGGFDVVGSYYGGRALGTLLFNEGPALGNDGFGCSAMTGTCNEADNWGYYIQGTYTFSGKTKVGVSYGESRQDRNAVYGIPSFKNTMWTVGVYHDVTSWLKVMAEYDEANLSGSNGPMLGWHRQNEFSIGGFLLW